MSKKILAFLFITILFLAACGGKKKKSMTGEDTVAIQDFFDFFPALQLPVNFSDSILKLKPNENDSLLIGSQVYHQFIPDTLSSNSFDKKEKIKFYSIGKFGNTKEELYLLSKAVAGNRKVIFLTAYDKENKYIAGMTLFTHDPANTLNFSVTVDPRFNINKDLAKKLANGNVINGHDVYALNTAAKKFMLIMTDSLGDAVTELINPIDTLARSFKYSADYGEGKMNLLSIRDGKRAGRINFFVHLQRDNKNCSGELKGEAIFSGPNVAEYRQGGDPCVLQFIFSNTSLTLKEVEGCGSRMGGLECTFNGTYPKKKAPKSPLKIQIVSKTNPKK